jgi:hypothetical protein
MAQNCLILYASRTGNTEKVAKVFQSVFEKNGWICDMVKVNRRTDATKLDCNFEDYDFMCVGSGVFDGAPPQEIINAIRKASTDQSKGEIPHEKIVPGPKKGIVFATYAGAHLGPKEAAPALKWLEVEMEHQKFKCIGSFCCPGEMKMAGRPKPTPEMMEQMKNRPAPPPPTSWWHGDEKGRPNEKDLLKAELFIEDILEEILVRHKGQYQG